MSSPLEMIGVEYCIRIFVGLFAFFAAHSSLAQAGLLPSHRNELQGGRGVGEETSAAILAKEL